MSTEAVTWISLESICYLEACHPALYGTQLQVHGLIPHINVYAINGGIINSLILALGGWRWLVLGSFN